MVGFTIEFTTKKNGLVEIAPNGDIKYWAGTGLPSYEGGYDGFKKEYPSIVEEIEKRFKRNSDKLNTLNTSLAKRKSS